MPRYLFDNAAGQTYSRFAALEVCYDHVSRQQLALTGLGYGWRCLEVGAGSGSLGVWLGRQTGPDGEVAVTDIEPRWTDPASWPRHVRLLRHDVTCDPLPAGHYDLVHARLVLLHLPERAAVLDRLVRALKPGGHLVLEEFDCGWTPVLAARSGQEAELFQRVHEGVLSLLERAGADPLWGRRVYGAMRAAGLEEVSASVFAEAWPGGSPGAGLHVANVGQVAHQLADDGITLRELERFEALLEDPGFAVGSYPLVSVRGRKAGAR